MKKVCYLHIFHKVELASKTLQELQTPHKINLINTVTPWIRFLPEILIIKPMRCTNFSNLFLE